MKHSYSKTCLKKREYMRVTIITDKKLNFEVSALAVNFGPDLQISTHLMPGDDCQKKIQSLIQTDLLIVSQSILNEIADSSDLNETPIKWLIALTNSGHKQRATASTHIASELIDFNDFNLDTLKKSIEIFLERQQLDRMLLNQQSRLQQLEKLALVGELAASVVHDISTPLTILSGHIEQMKIKIKNSQVLTLDDISKFEKSNFRLIDIVKTFRKMIHVTESNPLESLNLKDILTEVVELLQYKLSQQAIDLKFSGSDAASIQIEGRRQELIHAIFNVVTNSIDAVSNTPKKWIHIKIEEQPTAIIISVIDSGDGVSVNMAETMFEPFKSGKAKPSNLGMGLTIVKRVLQNHYGRINLDRSSAHTKIDLILPKKQRTKNSPTESLFFLVVDDQEDLARFISNEFLSRGYQSVVATNYKEALSQIKKNQPNVIITDIYMPVGTGLDIYKWVKENSPKTTVFFVTGHQLPFDTFASHIPQQNIYAKPFNPAELANSILNQVTGP